MILGFVCISKIELYTSGILQQNHNMLHVSQKPNAFTTKCRGSSLEESGMGPGNFTTKCLGFPRPFFNQISIFQPSCQRIFFYKMPCLPKLKWALDLFTRWPYHKMTYKNPFVVALRPPILYGKVAGGYHRPKANNKINQKQVCNPSKVGELAKG